jgi:hypothetical protein
MKKYAMLGFLFFCMVASLSITGQEPPFEQNCSNITGCDEEVRERCISDCEDLGGCFGWSMVPELPVCESGLCCSKWEYLCSQWPPNSTVKVECCVFDRTCPIN